MKTIYPILIHNYPPGHGILPPRILGRLVFQNHTLVDQFRFPRSKKKRMLKKWKAQPSNFRPSPHAFVTKDCIYIHPAFYRGLIDSAYGRGRQ